MPLDPARVEETKLWIQKAEADLRGAQWNLKAKPPFLEFSLFHAQQSVEKMMKAFLFWHDVRFQKIHDLGKLGKLCNDIDPTLSSLTEETAPLTEFAVQFRYPEEDIPPTSKQARDGVALAKKAYKEFLKRLPKECEPTG